jgi:hypothetical protein
MAPKISRHTDSPEKKGISLGESLRIEQRLQNLIELAITIGQREGLMGNHEEVELNSLEGGKDVANKGNIRDRKVAPVGQDKAGNQEEE